MDNETNISTDLHEAVLVENITRLKILLNDKSININQIVRNKTSALHLAMINGNENIVQMLMKKGANIDLKDSNDENSLHIAARFGNYSLVKLFLCNGININHLNKEEYTSLHIAVKYNHIDTVKILLKYNAKVNTWNSVGNSPLHEAVTNENIQLVKLLLNHGADLNYLNKENQSAFYESFLRHNECVIKLFLSYDVKVQQKNNLGQNALHLASLHSPKEVVGLLLGMNLNVNEPAFDGSTPLHYAVLNKVDTDLNIVLLLLASGANVDAEDKLGISALHLAMESQTPKAYENLVVAGANVNCITKDGSTPLHAALENGNMQAVHFLVKHGADVNVENGMNDMPLHLAIKHFKYQQSRDTVVKLLMDNGAIIDACNKSGSTALHLALKTEDTALFDLLITQMPDIHKRDADHKSPLFVAVCENNLHAAKMLLQLGAEATDYDEDRNTVLSTAVTRGNVEMVKLLLDYNAHINDQISVYEAASTDNVEVMKMLVGRGADVNDISDEGLSLLIIAITSLKDKMIQYLLDNGADINFKDIDDYYPLCHGFHVYHSIRNEIIIIILLKHIALMTSQNLYVHEENMKLIRREKFINEAYEDYCQELAKMKSMKVCADSPVTYFDMLVKRHRGMVRCLHCESVRMVLGSGNYKQQFLEYSDRVEENYRQGLRYMEIIDKSQLLLNNLFSAILPYDVICKINEYFSFDDLQEICSCNLEALVR